MRIIEPSFNILTEIDGNKILKDLERAGRTCYQSQDNITDESAKKFISLIIKNKHYTILEHCSVSVKIICDRGISHELVRHRLASFSQSSTRYCNYSKGKFDNEITVIDLATGFKYDLADEKDKIKYSIWGKAMCQAEEYYMQMIKAGAKPEEARSVLPNSLKTEIIMTANLREWIHIFNLRAIGTTGKPHPQIMEIMIPLLRKFQELIPVVFDNLTDSVDVQNLLDDIKKELDKDG